MKWIRLTKGYKAVVSDADYPTVSQHKWCALEVNGRVFAVRGARTPQGQRRLQYLQREIMNPAFGDRVTFVDGDPLNCTRENLLCVSAGAIVQRGRLHWDNTSGYKGVSQVSGSERWSASLRVKGEWKRLGTFDTPIEAAIEYNRAAREHYGPGAYQNEIP